MKKKFAQKKKTQMSLQDKKKSTAIQQLQPVAVAPLSPIQPANGGFFYQFVGFPLLRFIYRIVKNSEQQQPVMSNDAATDDAIEYGRQQLLPFKVAMGALVLYYAGLFSIIMHVRCLL